MSDDSKILDECRESLTCGTCHVCWKVQPCGGHPVGLSDLKEAQADVRRARVVLKQARAEVERTRGALTETPQETPQEKLERWCEVNTLGITAPIREAIRAVLGQLHDFERERDEARADWVALVDDNTATEAKLAEAQAALEGMVNCPVGGSGQRLPTPETVARARAALSGEGEK